VKLREMRMEVERDWMVSEGRTTYLVDLALLHADDWLPVTLGDRPCPAGGLCFPADADPVACAQAIQARLRASTGEPSDK